MHLRQLWASTALLLIAITAAAAAPGRAKMLDLYVATSGSDAWSGTLAAPNKAKSDGPFAALERARDAVRQAKEKSALPAGGATVWVRGGVYLRKSTFELGEQDSGSEKAPVVYRAYEGETVRIVGGPAIPPAAFQPVKDPAVLARLDESARGKVMQADLKALGITDFGKAFPPTFRGYAGWPELFFDRKPMEIARWPNEGFAKVAKVLDAGSKPRNNEKPDRPGKFVYEGDRPARWLTADEVYLNGYWCFKWFNECIKVAKIDPAEKSITFAAPHVYGVGGPSGGFYFALNLLEELDTPGEYYLDRGKGILYFWPPSSLSGRMGERENGGKGAATATLQHSSTPTLQHSNSPIPANAEIGLSLMDAPLVALTNTAHVTLRGFTFEFSRGLAVSIAGGSRNLVAGCTMRNLAVDAVRIAGGERNGVLSCDLYNLGGSGIALDGGDRVTLKECGNFAENCHIHHFGRLFRTHRDAVSLNGVGCRASHNSIHDAPHHAMNFGGNCHLVEMNEIYDVCTETDDAGSIYTGRDWTVRGTVIRHNFFHDIGGSAHVGNQAIYVDDNACGITSVGNVIFRVYRAFLIGGGRDNVMENNVIVECKIPMHIDNRGMNWAGKKSENWGTLTGRLKAVPYQSDAWRARFPELVNILDDAPETPKGNRVARNLIVRCGEMHLAKEAREMGTIQDNWATAEDPGFVNAAGLNFALKPDAPALRQIPGFVRIPFEKIGLYRDEYRKVLPVNNPSATPATSAFVGETTVTLAPDSRSPGAVIRYTTDQSDPTDRSAVYTKPLRLTGTTTVKAAAFASAGGVTERSGTVTATYTARHLGPGKGVFLSDLPAGEVQAHGGLKVDTNYAGGPISLAGRKHEKGLMLCPETTPQGGRGHATFDLAGGLAKAQRFLAAVGIEDTVKIAGSVIFRVEVERAGKWEQVFLSPILKGGDAQEVSVDITGARRLRLITTDAGDNINSDHAVWAGAKVE